MADPVTAPTPLPALVWREEVWREGGPLKHPTVPLSLSNLFLGRLEVGWVVGGPGAWIGGLASDFDNPIAPAFRRRRDAQDAVERAVRDALNQETQT